MITFFPEDVPALIAFACLCVAAATIAILAMICLLFLASGWRARRRDLREATRARQQLAELRFAVRDVIARVNGLGTSGTGQYAAHLMGEHLTPFLGDDPEQALADDARASRT